MNLFFQVIFIRLSSRVLVGFIGVLCDAGVVF